MKQFVKVAVLFVLILSVIQICYALDQPPAQTTDDPNRPHGAMELFGMGPEMWGNRAKAWVLNIADVLDAFVAKVGVLGLAAIAVYQNLKQKAEIKDRLDQQKDRLDQQGERIHQVALAVPAVATVKVAQPPGEPIPVTTEQP
jgi:hypothetical protein